MSYTVADLRKDIAELPGDMEIMLQVDPEGNSWRQVRGVDELGLLDPSENSWFTQELYGADWTWEEACFDSEEEWEEWKAAAKKFAVIFP